MFYIENSSVSEIGKELDNFFDLIKEENLEVVNLVSYWFNNYLKSLYDKTPGSIEKISDKEVRRKFDSIMEVKNMFATRTREHDKIIGQQYLEKDIEQGIEKNSEETARRMLDDGLSIDIIAKYTGLSDEALQELKGK